MKENRASLESVIERSITIALVKVRAVRHGGRMVQVNVVECFKGRINDGAELWVPTLWGKYASDWFKKGEEALIFTVDAENTLFGMLGRMPLVAIDGEIRAESFASNESFFAGLSCDPRDGRLTADWNELREFVVRVVG